MCHVSVIASLIVLQRMGLVSPLAQAPGVLGDSAVDDISESSKFPLQILRLDIEEEVSAVDDLAGLGLTESSGIDVLGTVAEKLGCCVACCLLHGFGSRGGRLLDRLRYVLCSLGNA